MAALTPLAIFLVEVILIVAVGETLLKAADIGGKMAAVWAALGIGFVMSVVVFIASQGGTPEETPVQVRSRH